MEGVTSPNTFENALRSVFVPKIKLGQLRSASQSNAGKLASWLFGGPTTEAGRKVTIDTSLKLSAFYCGVNIISSSVALLPVGVWETNTDGRYLIDHPLNSILGKTPNSYLSGFTFRKILTASALLKGNGYAERIVDQATGRLSAYRFLDAGRVRVIHNEDSDRITYEYKGRLIASEDMIHIRGNTFDGVVGRSVLRYAADNLGISLSAMEFGANAYNDRGIQQGVLESALEVGPEAKKALSSAFQSAMASGDPYRVAVIDEGMKYKSIAITPQEAKFLEAYASGIGDVARWLNLPPHKLKDLTNANYSNIYQMSLEFLGDSLMPWVTQFEEEFTRKELTPNEIIAGRAVNFDESALLRPDLKTKGEYIRAMLLSGVFTQNEARQMADKNRLDGENYDSLLQPVNLQNQQQLEKTIQDE